MHENPFTHLQWKASMLPINQTLTSQNSSLQNPCLRILKLANDIKRNCKDDFDSNKKNNVEASNAH